MMGPTDDATIKIEQRERLQHTAVDRLVEGHRPNKRIRYLYSVVNRASTTRTWSFNRSHTLSGSSTVK